MPNDKKILIGILNPREIPEFQECIEKIKDVDKVFIKYFAPENDAYYTLRLFFLYHPEYTHLMIMPDDITFTPENVKSLIDDVNKYNFPVITGFSNLDKTSGKDTYTIGLEGEYMERSLRKHNLLTKSTLFDEKGNSKLGKYIKVKWLGFSLTTIRRDVVELIEFQDDAKWNNIRYGNGCCVDTSFSFLCNNNNIPMYCNTSVQIVHMRISTGSLMTNFYAGKKPRQIVHEKDGKIYQWNLKLRRG